MLLLGLTGGIASGKSVVSKMLAALGAPIIDADQIAKEAVEVGRAGWQAVVDSFGAAYLLPDGGLDREKLGALVFHDAAARKRLNGILHPTIEKATFAQAALYKQQGKKAAVIDVPLLFEVGWRRHVDIVWVVAVKEKLQLRRLMSRGGYSEEAAMARIKSQMPLKEKIAQADVVIDNNGDLVYTKLQVEQNWRKLIDGNE